MASRSVPVSCCCTTASCKRRSNNMEHLQQQSNPQQQALHSCTQFLAHASMNTKQAATSKTYHTITWPATTAADLRLTLPIAYAKLGSTCLLIQSTTSTCTFQQYQHQTQSCSLLETSCQPQAVGHWHSNHPATRAAAVVFIPDLITANLKPGLARLSFKPKPCLTQTLPHRTHPVMSPIQVHHRS